MTALPVTAISGPSPNLADELAKLLLAGHETTVNLIGNGVLAHTRFHGLAVTG